jgi:arginyl-tRNA--protein-N-Asp/Glu arginylyltransferase
LTASLRDIRVYTTFPHVCSYLPDQEATTLFIDPRQQISQELYTQLSVMGFRRSGDHIYRPHCVKCNACVPSRVIVDEFQRSKSQDRVWRRNSDLRIAEADSIDDDEAYDLYRRYIEGRHSDGDMYPPDRDQYSSFLNNGLGCTRYFELRHEDKLIAVLVTDQTLDGLSAIYTFYDPGEEKRSLGTFAVLFQIEEAKHLSLDYVYLGYWIQNCGKMNYKARFSPLELLQSGCWQRRDNLPEGGDLGPSMPLRFVDKPE